LQVGVNLIVASVEFVAAAAAARREGQTAEGTPTGTVTFFDNGTQLGSPVELTGSAAQLMVSALLSGQHSITAIYGGDSNFSPSASAVAAMVAVSIPGFTLNPDL
jgi:hypothetical protein